MWLKYEFGLGWVFFGIYHICIMMQGFIFQNLISPNMSVRTHLIEYGCACVFVCACVCLCATKRDVTSALKVSFGSAGEIFSRQTNRSVAHILQSLH